MSKNKWLPDFNKWYQIDKDAYKLIFQQAEKKLEDVLSESESLTDKSIKMVMAVVAMFAFFLGFIIQQHIPLGYNSIFIVLFLLNVFGIIFLIFPKEVKRRGFSPQVFIPNNLDNEEDKGFQEEILYYNGIVLLQENIEFMRDKNNYRARIYLYCLIMALTLFCAGTTFIIASL